MEQFEYHLIAAQSGNKRAVSKLISIVEHGGPDVAALSSAIQGHLGNARVIGITGPPGAGKSTLVDRLVRIFRERGERVGVIAVDPSSMFTGGAILGDRVRMSGGPDDGLFFRSMGTRGAIGGLSDSTRGAVNVLDACSFSLIIVETVGVGQSEIEIVNLADIVLVLAVPGLGDDIQSIKAGLLEIGDIYVVNKCDLPGGDRVAAELKASLSFAPDDLRRGMPVVMVSAKTGLGLVELVETLDTQYISLADAGKIDIRRGMRAIGLQRSDPAFVGGAARMKCLHIDHIGVAVKNLTESTAFYTDVLGINSTGIEEVDDQKVRVMFIPCGDCEFELLESTTANGPVARFIEKNGEGVQHIAVRVDDIDTALTELKERGIRLIDETPRYGAGGARIAFIHPKATNGVLLELCERK